MLPSTLHRVPGNTPEQYNRAIRSATRARVVHLATDHDAIDARLHELDREWDIERTLEANAASVMLGGVALAALVDRRFLVLPALVGGFLLQHALQGWCPPLPIFRRMGVRTAEEIAEERFALKALRGDFEEVSSHTPHAAA